MGLTNSLNIGRTGLLTHQTGIEVTGNNLANVATPGFKRQGMELGATGDRRAGHSFVGQGVGINAITRQVSEAVESRLRSAISGQGGSAVLQGRLEQLEALQNELSGNDLSTALDGYFDAWSQLATNPQDPALRGLVVSEGVSLAGFVKDLRAGYGDLETESIGLLGEGIDAANNLLTQIEDVNQAIQSQEGGSGGEASSLRDRRDGLLAELAKYVEISVNELPSGEVDVFVGTLPVILDGKSRGLELRKRTVDGVDISEIVTASDQTVINLTSGELASHLAFANGGLSDATQGLDDLASQLIYQTNRIHSQSQALNPANTYVGSYAVADADAVLTDLDATELPFAAHHGSFQVHLSAGNGSPRQTTAIAIDLDGLGGPGTTLNGLAAQLNAVNGIAATVDATGRLTVAGDTPSAAISFSDDSSGVLAALGIGGFFLGKNAADMAVVDVVANDPTRLAAARGYLSGDNRGALAASNLRDVSLAELSGRSVTQTWTDRVARDAAELSRVRDGRASAATVADNLRAQQQAVSGVNADEETINLLQYQRAYQASARYLTVVDEMLQTLLRVI